MPADFSRHSVAAAELFFPEGLRWRDGSLWFSDVFGGTVSCLSRSGTRVVAEVPGQPSGLGWLPDGTLLAVSMQEKALRAVAADGSTSTYADLSEVCPQLANDMVVDAHGRAYVGNYGYDVDAGAPVEATHLVRVNPDGAVLVEPPEVVFPNGCVIVDDGWTLLVAETFADRVTEMSIGRDGGLFDPRPIVELPAGSGPDGIAVTADGVIWVPCAYGERAVAVTRGGEVVDEIRIPGVGVNCCVIGDDGHTLFVAVAPLDEVEAAAHPAGRILAVPLS
ncbi:MAG TPA: SMP-30/gluconolactonase/LRE family protein [Mycobacteriales bacterium]|nr:SMP-30/gluconolactonase/LRE family protein [Mycobacteriales bacterium]